MRLFAAIGVAVLAIGMSAPLAHAQAPIPFHLINQLVPPGLQQSAAQGQDDLSQLPTPNPGPINVDFVDVQVDELLELLAEIGGFEIQLNPEVEELLPMTLAFTDTNFDIVLRFVLNAAGLGWAVSGDGTLVVFRQ